MSAFAGPGATDVDLRSNFHHSGAARASRKSGIPNYFAYFALFAWPVVCIGLFARLPVEKAAISSLLGGYLLLPSATSVDVALLPPLDKTLVTAVATSLLCWMKGTEGPRPRRSLAIYFFATLFVVSPIFTAFNNSYELRIGNTSLQGFYPLDGFKLSLRNLFTLAPFFVGMRFLSSDKGRSLLLKSLPIAALFYSIPMLFEVRFSPVLHSWVYGFFPHSFVQQYRNGGFRPVVFLGHGLEVALFACMALVAAIVATRAKWRIFKFPARAVAAYLAMLLLLCKSLASIVYAIILGPVVLFTRPRTWWRISAAILLIVVAYPVLRGYDIIPVHKIAEVASQVSADRASSFQTRVSNEDVLLTKGNEKPFFGWGTWGRNRVYDSNSGEDVSVTDGFWVIQFGSYGWAGYLSLFGLFAASVLNARSAVRGPVTEASVVLGGLCLLLAVNVGDLIPNSDILPLTYVIAGAIAGRRISSRRSGSRTSKGRGSEIRVRAPEWA